MIKAVLFDLDGTLLDRESSVRLFISGQYNRLNQSLGSIPEASYTARFLELDNHGYVWKDKVYQQLIKEFNLTGVTWQALLADYIDHFQYHTVPFPGLIKMLEKLKETGCMLGIISNGKADFQNSNINALGIRSFFDVILVSESEGIKKPDEEIFKRALSWLDVQPEESVYVGDHPQNDIIPAQRTGMKTIWKVTAQWQNVPADCVIENLAEIPSIIDKWRNETAN